MCGIVVTKRATLFIHVWYCGHIGEQGGWLGSLMRVTVTVACPKGWAEEAVRVVMVWTSDVAQQFFYCMVVRTLMVLAMPGVRGRTLI